jgi:hypothetical protein
MLVSHRHRWPVGKARARKYKRRSLRCPGPGGLRNCWRSLTGGRHRPVRVRGLPAMEAVDARNRAGGRAAGSGWSVRFLRRSDFAGRDRGARDGPNVAGVDLTAWRRLPHHHSSQAYPTEISSRLRAPHLRPTRRLGRRTRLSPSMAQSTKPTCADPETTQSHRPGEPRSAGRSSGSHQPEAPSTNATRRYDLLRCHVGRETHVDVRALPPLVRSAAEVARLHPGGRSSCLGGAVTADART